MRIAAMDLGSNSFHLLVVEARPDGTFDPLVREKEMLRLGDAVARTGRIGDDRAGRALEVLHRFDALAESLGVDERVALATSALREAENGAELVDRIEAEVGCSVEVISGAREARLIFGAVRASVLIDPGPALALDLGGGSLEVMVGDRAQLCLAESLKLGVARLTADLVHDDPLSAADLGRLRGRVERDLAPLAGEVARLGPRMLVGSSGTLCALARMAVAQRSGEVPSSVNQLTVALSDLGEVHQRLVSLPAAERQRLPGLESRRVDLAPTGSVVLMSIMDMFGFDRLTTSEWALREGIVIEAIGAHDPADWTDDARGMRRASVLDLCRRCGWQESHATQVARLAIDLFDQTLPLHGLGPDDRELLDYGALLHDIGEHVSVEGHERHTAYLIENGRLRGFSPEEINLLACLGRFHRRGSPKVSFDAFASLNGKGRDRAVRLVALLRVADALDRSHAGSVEGIDVELLADQVRLRALCHGDIELERWGLRRKRGLFEEVFGRRLEVSAAVPAGTRN